MTATNHVLTGAVFMSLTLDKAPLWLILPTAFLLHFILDALPHFGTRNDERAALERLKWILPIDAFIGATILLIVAAVQPAHWVLIDIGGILCASPDLWSATRFIRFLRSGETRINGDWFARFHHWLQWGERPWGGWVEAVWFVAFGLVLWMRL